MILFNFWAKYDAHRVIGQYAWYWGDFFFRIEQNLTFDGIFEMFPHPMYTVGYSFFYGFALISRSYTVLFVSLIAHVMQLCFLVFVENPHIERTYGNSDARESIDPQVFQMLYVTSGGKEARDSSVLFWKFDFLSISDIATFVASFYAFLLCYQIDDPWWSLFHIGISRSMHWIIVGFILMKQGQSNWWVSFFEKRGFTRQYAFQTWKQLYNFTSTLNLIIFVSSSFLSFFQSPFPKDNFGDFLLPSPKDLACIFFGVVLILVNAWAYVSMYQNLGDFGWHYGDFFIPSSMYRPQISYSGVYRFMNNPDCIIGYAGLHGVALVCRSWRVFIVALIAQALNIVFVNVVEVPHMNKLYEQQGLRKAAPLERAIKQKLPQAIKESTQQMREEAAREIFQLYSRLTRDEHSAVFYDFPSEVSLGECIRVRIRTNKYHALDDWVGLYLVGSASAPGQSEGRWQCVPQGEIADLLFEGDRVPVREGVYEFRYHRNGGYEIAGRSSPIFIS
jgi:phosphatidylethanolamine N-methyltransferase